MKKIFVIGGMGAGKSTAAKALADQGLPLIDLDKVGHEVLKWPTVKEDLRLAFGDEIFDADGEINRKALAAKAFETARSTSKLNHITMPRIEEAYIDLLSRYQKSNDYVVVEYSVFRDKKSSLAFSADKIIAVTAPVEMRVARAVAAGWAEEDVRARLSQQISDANRIMAADVVFANTGTPEELRQHVVAWWKVYSENDTK